MKALPWIASAVMMGGILVYALSLDRKGEVPAPAVGEQQATFAGGCYWCMEAAFEEQPGVSAVVSGYAGHREAIRVNYDPSVVSYDQLLDIFWRNIDPTDSGGQFVDRGSQYSTAILFHTTEQQQAAVASRQTLAKSGRFNKPIATQIEPTPQFHPAKEHEQDYHRRHAIGYGIYRKGSGRDSFFRKTWEDGTSAK